ncbi:unnamed protein product, partial [Ectocarpus sp. 12 AP-2014]
PQQTTAHRPRLRDTPRAHGRDNMSPRFEAEFSWRDVHWMAPLWQLLAALERLSSLHPVSVIARKRLDVSFPDMARACRLSVKALTSGKASEAARDEALREVARAWSPIRSDSSSSSSSSRRRGCGPTLPPPPPPPAPIRSNNGTATAGPIAKEAAEVAPFLSVRTAFDLYLKALDLPQGSLVVCSALTIPDMVTIFEEHGLVPVPVDLDPETLAPEPRALEAEVARCGGGGGTESGGEQQQKQRVRAIYVAHVFGAQVDMTHIVEAAARHGLLLWEDCAQMFTGLGGYLGHPDSDAAFFSFGVIKRATAFGGGIARIRDAQRTSCLFFAAMLREEAEYPSQSAAAYLRRVLKCSLMLALTTPLLFGIILHTLAVLGIEHDEVVMKLSKGFPKKGLMRAIRHRASIPLLQMLAWRISRYPTEGVEIRLQHCNRMLSVLEAALSQRQRQPQPPRALPPRGGGAAREEPSALSVGEGEEGGGGVGVGDVLPGV